MKVTVDGAIYTLFAIAAAMYMLIMAFFHYGEYIAAIFCILFSYCILYPISTWALEKDWQVIQNNSLRSSRLTFLLIYSTLLYIGFLFFAIDYGGILDMVLAALSTILVFFLALEGEKQIKKIEREEFRELHPDYPIERNEYK